MRFSSRCLALSLPFVFLAVAWGDEDSVDTTLGDSGRLQLTYHRSSIFDDTRPAREPLAEGAHAVIRVHGDDPLARYRAQISGEAVTIEDQDRLYCMCRESFESGESAHSVPSSDTCRPPAQKQCDRLISVKGVKAGQATLEFRGADDQVLDTVPLSTVAVARLAPMIRITGIEGGRITELAPQSDGSFETFGPVKLYLSAKALDASGKELEASPEDVTFSTDDIVLGTEVGRAPEARVLEPVVARVEMSGLGTTTTFDLRITEPPARE